MRETLVLFEWAMKNRLRNKANFPVLEGFLSELLHQSIRIEHLLESESDHLDILTQVLGGDLVLIELHAGMRSDYIHRAISDSSTSIIDYLNTGGDFDHIRKVISINIAYFNLGKGVDYVYRGTTEFRGVHHADTLHLSPLERKMFQRIAPENVPMEYFILRLKKFDDVLRNSLDEWVYFLKTTRIKSDYMAQGLDVAAECMALAKLSEAEWDEYEGYIKDRRILESELKTAFLDGMAEGRREGFAKGLEEARQKGRREEKRGMMIKLLANGISPSDALEIVGLSAEEWAALDVIDSPS